MTLKSLYYFKKLASFEHMIKAAKSLYISQPTLSYTISELEKELGTKLFDRKNKSMKLNAHGKKFLNYVNQSLSILEKGISDIHKDLESSISEVKIGFIQSLGENFIPELVSAFYKANPEISKLLKFVFIQEEYANLVSLFKKSEIDILFGIEKIESGNSFLFTKQKLSFISNIDSPLANKQLKLENLKNENFILINKKTKLRSIISSLFDEVPFYPNVNFEMSDCSNIIKYVEKGFGISIVPTDLVEKHFKISILKVHNFNIKRPIFVSWHREIYSSYQSKLFKNFIIDYKKIINK